MKRQKQHVARFVTGTVVSWIVLAFGATGLAQGTVTFTGWGGLSSTYYEENGMRFQLVIPPATSGRDDMGIINATDPFMVWFRQHNPYSYVSLHLTNGSTFGLTSVRLADPSETSPSQVRISFIGFLAGGPTVTNTFVTLGGARYAFQDYAFSPAFAADVLDVRIEAPRWAMDNLVFTIPEPTAGSLLALGLLALGWGRCLPGSRSSACPASPQAKPTG